MRPLPPIEKTEKNDSLLLDAEKETGSLHFYPQDIPWPKYTEGTMDFNGLCYIPNRCASFLPDAQVPVLVRSHYGFLGVEYMERRFVRMF
jgi:hypothetical protein